MSANGSISGWIATLRGGNLEPIQQLWDRYKSGLIAAARRHLSTVPKLTVNDDDIAQSVLVAIWRGGEAGLFDKVADRDELWWTLLKITRRKVVTAYRRERTKKRGKWWIASKERLATDLGIESIGDLLDSRPSPEMICAIEEQTGRLIDCLRKPDLQKVAVWRIEGLSVNEIAERLSLTPRSIERKLNIIRRRWCEELRRVES